jgi:drug/metabolite transporter (DMT)-like permease
MRLKADLTLFIIAIIWGSAFVAQRIAGELGSVYYFNGIRYLLAGLVVLPFAWYANRSMGDESFDKPPSNSTHDGHKWMAIAGFLLFVAAAFQQAGMQYTTAGNAGFITSLYVVIVPFIVYIGWKEKPHWLSVVAVGMAAVGAYLLSTGGSFEVRRGDVLELAGAFFWAMHVIVLGKFASKFEPMSFSVGQLLVCGFLNLGVGILVEEPVFTCALAGAAIYTAILSLGLCYTLQVWAQRYTPPSDAALILSLESVFAVLAGSLLLDEQLMRIQIAGCLLIFVAVCLSQANSWNLWGKIDRNHLVEGR